MRNLRFHGRSPRSHGAVSRNVGEFAQENSSERDAEHDTYDARDGTTSSREVVFTSAPLDAVRQLATRTREDFALVRNTTIDGSRP